MNARYTFRTIPPELADFKRWRRVDTSALTMDEKTRFTRLRRALELYLLTGKLTQASRESGYAAVVIIKQLNRCVTIAGDGQPWGWAGLLSRRRIGHYTRHVPSPQGPRSATAGFAGAFEAFLDAHDDLRRALDDLILPKDREGVFQERELAVRELTNKFRRLCLLHGIREDEYPLNTKSCARRTLARYQSALIAHKPYAGIKAHFGEEAAKRLRVGTGECGIATALAPYDVGGIDAHEEHCIGCVIIPGPAGPQRVAIERMWLVVHAEQVSHAVLGYAFGIRTEASSTTVEESLICTGKKWTQRDLTIPGLRYDEGSGLPSGVIPELEGCYPAILRFDNAAAHFANRIAEAAKRRIGCAITWGGIGHWEHNAVVERFFKTLETYGFQRLPSSTGSNATDAAKRDPIEKATRIGITWDALLDLADVLIANYNVKKSRGLGGQSPLQVLRTHLALDEPTFLPRILPFPTVDQPEIGITVETRVVRGNQRQGRRPYVEIDRVHYTSAALAKSFGLIGSKLRLHVREADMRTVRAFFESGEELGVLQALGSWGRSPHTREMRKIINALCDAGELELRPGRDPIQALGEYYSSKAYRDALERPHSVSKSGTKLANWANQSNRPIPAAEPIEQNAELLDDPETAVRPIPSTIKAPVWKSIT